MSADLLEAFGGDGEDPTVRPSPAQPKLVNDSPAVAQRRDTGLIHSRRFDPQPPPLPEEPLWTAGTGGNDVLFDAADEENTEAVDDDFGDFEDVQQPVHHGRTAEPDPSRHAPPSAAKVGQETTLIDLLSLDETTEPYRQTKPATHRVGDLLTAESQDTGAPSSSSKGASRPSPPDEDEDWGDFEDVGSSQPEATKAIQPQTDDRNVALPAVTATQKLPPVPESTLEDDWAAFEDGEPEPLAQPAKTSAAPEQPSQPAEEDDWDAFEDGTPSIATPATTKPQNPPHTPASEPTSSAFPPSATRPTNIPPPSTILSLLPSIYTSLQTPTAPLLLLHLYQATARIIAARPQRWRRDTVLAQSTRIAPASGKAGGMKLSSVNKGEAAREEREASEALAAWNGGVPRWHGVLREGGVSVGPKGWRLQLPLGVKSVAAREGGLEAVYVCPVCGMKRSERVVGVDEAVEDVFGEFWVEGWVHRACGEVWYRFKGLLGQR